MKKENNEKSANFFNKFVDKIKELFKKLMAWSKAHLPLAIGIATGIVVVIALAIVLPITLSKNGKESVTPATNSPQNQGEEAKNDPDSKPLDTTKPVITVNPEIQAALANPIDIDTYQWFLIFTYLGIKVEDDVDGEIPIDRGAFDMGGFDSENPQPGNYTLTYTVSDAAGNTSSITLPFNLIDTSLTQEELFEKCLEDTFGKNLSMRVVSTMEGYQEIFEIAYQDESTDDIDKYHATLSRTVDDDTTKEIYCINSSENYSFVYTEDDYEAQIDKCTIDEMNEKIYDYHENFIALLLQKAGDEFELDEDTKTYEAKISISGVDHYIKINFKGKTAVINHFEYGHGTTVDYSVDFSSVGTTSITLPDGLMDKYYYTKIVDEILNASYKNFKVTDNTSVQKYDFEHKVASFAPLDGNDSLTQYWLIDKGLVLALDYDDSKNVKKWIPTTKSYEAPYFEYQAFMKQLIPTNLMDIEFTSMDYLTNSFVLTADDTKVGDRYYYDFELTVTNGKIAKLKGQYNSNNFVYNFSSYNSLTMDAPSYNLSDTTVPNDFLTSLKIAFRNSNMLISDSDSSKSGIYSFRETDDYKLLYFHPANGDDKYIFRIGNSEHTFTVDSDGKIKNYSTDTYSFNATLNKALNAVTELKKDGKLCSYSNGVFKNGDYKFSFNNGLIASMSTEDQFYLITYNLNEIIIPAAVQNVINVILQ